MTLAHIKPETREIPLGLLDPPPNPSRVGMEENELDELARSIRLNGLLQPLIVARDGARYQIVAGHRRSIAAGRAGLVAVECRVFPTVSTALMAVQYAENRFRADLSAAEEAILFSEVLEREAGGDVDKLCELIGEKRAYIEGRLNLFAGDELVFKALLEKKIQIGVAHKLNEIGEQRMRRYYLDAAVRGGATIAVVSAWVQQWKHDSQYMPSAEASSTPAPAPSAVPQLNYFTCVCCDGTDNPHLMVPINVHQHCKLAILDKLLSAYKGQA